MKIEFSTGNAAFDEYRDYEVKRILEKIIEQVENGYEDGVIMDINGNKIGEWTMKSLQKRLLESVQNYYERELNDYDKIEKLNNVINLAYTTTGSGKHEVQVDFDIEKLEWQEYIDGQLKIIKIRRSIEEFINELNDCSFNSITDNILFMAEEMEENEND